MTIGVEGQYRYRRQGTEMQWVSAASQTGYSYLEPFFHFGAGPCALRCSVNSHPHGSCSGAHGWGTPRLLLRHRDGRHGHYLPAPRNGSRGLRSGAACGANTVGARRPTCKAVVGGRARGILEVGQMGGGASQVKRGTVNRTHNYGVQPSSAPTAVHVTAAAWRRRG